MENTWRQLLPDSKIITDSRIKEYTSIVRAAMGDKRYIHSVNVADMCVRLAERHGYADTRKAYAAGILHDIRKEAGEAVIKGEVERYGIQSSAYPPDPAELNSGKLHHAIAGAYYAVGVLGVAEDVADAIRFHTVGRAGMTLLEKIVYIADLVSAERRFPDVERYRKTAFDNLELAVFEAVKFTIARVMDKNGAIPHYSFEAYNHYIGLANRRNGK